MSKLQELIRELCPDGVEYKRLEEVSEFRAGWGFPESEQGKTNGKYPFYKVSDMNSSDVFMDVANNYISEETSIKLRCKPAPKGTIIFPKIGATMGTNKKRILTKDSCYDNNVMGLIAKSSVINDMFLYYYFSRFKLMDFAKGTGAVPSLDTNKLKKFLIPVPPLEVQKEIVRILDHFTDLAAELQAELQARKEQYEYYKHTIFKSVSIHYKDFLLKEIATFSQGIQVDPNLQYDTMESGRIRFLRIVDFVSDNEPYRYIETPSDKYIKSENELIMIRYGASAAGKVFMCYSGAIANNMFKINLKPEILPKYVMYYLSQNSIYTLLNSSGGKSTMPAINFKLVGSIHIPIPPYSEQQCIVSILDKFEALVNDLQQGLPAEIAAVQEQYEYYRNKILSFPRIKIGA